jgi:hypothetical protein
MAMKHHHKLEATYFLKHRNDILIFLDDLRAWEFISRDKTHRRTSIKNHMRCREKLKGENAHIETEFKPFALNWNETLLTQKSQITKTC